jgi:hypothetical protein
VVFWICYAAGGLGLKVVWLYMVHREAGWVWKQIFLHIIIQNYFLLIQEIKCKISQALFPYHAFLFFSFNDNLYSSNCGHMRSDIIILLLYNKLNELLYFQKKRHWQPWADKFLKFLFKNILK